MAVELDGALERRAAVHAALGDAARLGIVEALSLSDASPSEIGERLGIESNLLAHHLDVLVGVGLIERMPSHADRRRRYLRLRREVLDGLARALAVPIEASRVVFVCTANSARSQLAAALWNARHEVAASSGGTEPAEKVHPEAVRAARRVGLELGHAKPAAFTRRVGAKELVVTVCDRAHEQLWRAPTPPRRSSSSSPLTPSISSRPPITSGRWLHWSVADPAAVGTAKAFDRALAELDERITALAPLVVAGRRGRKGAR